MKRALCLVVGLLTLSLLPASAAEEKSYPVKNPVLKYVVPEKWSSETDASNGSVTLSSEDERIGINFVETEAEGTMEVFKALLPEILKEYKDAKEAEAPKEQTMDGLSGFTATYSCTVEGSPVLINLVLFKAGKDRSVFATFALENLATLPKEETAKLEAFMKSLKGA